MSNKPDHASRGHAEFSPSQIKYLAKCAGYQGKDETNAAAEMGTRIHEALEVRDPSALHNEEELNLYDEIVKEEDNMINSFLAGNVGVHFNEIQVDVELEGTKTWGTCDKLVTDGSRALMADYKTGISPIDPPEKNWQAKAYVIGAFQKFAELTEITFVFYVPQRGEVLTHTFAREDLPTLVKEVSAVILRAEAVRPKWTGGTPALEDLRPTPNCRFCRHEDYCPALGGLVLEVAKKIDPQLPDVDIESTEDPKVIEDLWNIAKVVSNWSDRLKARALEMAKNGIEFPSLRLQSMGSTKKVLDNATLFAIAEKFGMDQQEVIAECTIPLAKVAKAVSDRYEKGERKKISQEFLDACTDAGIIESSDTRYTLR